MNEEIWGVLHIQVFGNVGEVKVYLVEEVFNI